MQVPSLDAPFSIFIDLCSCDFPAVGSLIHSAGELFNNQCLTLSFIAVSLFLNTSVKSFSFRLACSVLWDGK